MGEAAFVLTNENAPEFYARKLDLVKPEPAVAPAKADEPAVESAKDESKGKEPSVEAADETLQHPDPVQKTRINARFSDLTKARDEAKAKADEAEKRAAEAERRAAEAEARRAALEAQVNPRPKDEVGPEPKREQFINDDEFLQARVDHEVEKREIERRKNEAEQARVKSWTDRQNEARKAISGYDEALKGSADLVISNEVRDAIVDSEVGPWILHHLAANPAEVTRLAGLTRGAALLQVGKWEAKFEAERAKAPPAPKTEQNKQPSSAASEKSRAPAPIDPLKGTGSGNGFSSDLIDSEGNVTRPVSASEWRALRKAGKV